MRTWFGRALNRKSEGPEDRKASRRADRTARRRFEFAKNELPPHTVRGDRGEK
jgi:hypothetical protein